MGKLIVPPAEDNTTGFKVDVGDRIGQVSDGYHTFDELYEFRMLYQAALFNGWSLDSYLELERKVKSGDVSHNELLKHEEKYDVHKSRCHSDGELCFGGGYFIVMAELPTGQISNHYKMDYWDWFKIPIKDKANEWDGHTAQDVVNRLNSFIMHR